MLKAWCMLFLLLSTEGLRRSGSSPSIVSPPEQNVTANASTAVIAESAAPAASTPETAPVQLKMQPRSASRFWEANPAWSKMAVNVLEVLFLVALIGDFVNNLSDPAEQISESVMIPAWFLVQTMINVAEGQTWIEGLYAATQITTTVGYGDLSGVQSTNRLRLLYGINIFVAGAFIMSPLNGVIDLLFMGRFRRWIGPGLPSSTALTGIMLGFGVLFYSMWEGEDKSVLDALYMSIATLTTVGYGDYSPSTRVGQMLAIPWMLFGVPAWSDFSDKLEAAMQRFAGKQGEIETKNRMAKIRENAAQNMEKDYEEYTKE